jgi:hypothetical protein
MTAMRTPESIRQAGFWLFLLLYLVIGGLGAWLFWQAVHDIEWMQIFSSVWWIPSGLTAWWARHRIENHLLRG